MPCLYDADEIMAIMRADLNIATRAACEFAEVASGKRKYVSAEVAKWQRDHEEKDAEEKRRKEQLRKEASLRQAAASKLSLEERQVLGLDGHENFTMTDE